MPPATCNGSVVLSKYYVWLSGLYFPFLPNVRPKKIQNTTKSFNLMIKTSMSVVAAWSCWYY